MSPTLPSSWGQSSRYCSPPKYTWGWVGILQDAAAALITGTQLRADSSAAQLCKEPGRQINRSTKVRFRLSRAAKRRCISREDRADPRHTGADITGSGHSQHRCGATAHLHHLVVGDAEILSTGGADGGGAAADGGQRLGGTLCQLFRLMV